MHPALRQRVLIPAGKRKANMDRWITLRTFDDHGWLRFVLDAPGARDAESQYRVTFRLNDGTHMEAVFHLPRDVWWGVNAGALGRHDVDDIEAVVIERDAQPEGEAD